MPKDLVRGKELVSALWWCCRPCGPPLPDCSDRLTISQIQFTNRSRFSLGNSLTAISKEWEDTDLTGNKTLAVG